MPQIDSDSIDISKLSFTTEGNDLVVRLPFVVNSSEHVSWTSITRQPGRIRLNFEIIQNRDLYERSQKSIELEWRIPDCKPDAFAFHVARAFTPSTSELARLLPSLQDLIDNGRKFGEGG